MTEPYEPINCDIYERYELAVMHRQALRVRWRDAGGMTHLDVLVPTDLRAREGEEYLYARTAGGEARIIRLDEIVDAMPHE